MVAVNAGAAADPTTTTIAVTGMTCAHCVAAVTAEVSKLAAVVAVTVDLDSGAVTVESNGPVDPAALVAAIDEAGYEVAG
jgi:copper chaperone CopZ